MFDCEEVSSVEGECVPESLSLDQPLDRPSIQGGVQVQDNQDVVSVSSAESMSDRMEACHDILYRDEEVQGCIVEPLPQPLFNS